MRKLWQAPAERGRLWTHMASASHGVPVYSPGYAGTKLSTAWWQRQMWTTGTWSQSTVHRLGLNPRSPIERPDRATLY